MTPLLVAFTIFVTYSVFIGELTADIVFPTLSLLSTVQQQFYTFPQAIANVLDAYVGLQRIQGFISLPDRVEYIQQFKRTGHPTDPGESRKDCCDEDVIMALHNTYIVRRLTHQVMCGGNDGPER
jgi:hypothetical protein